MKRTILSLFLLLAAFAASAQTIEYMGVPIEGTLDEFSAKLVENGFEPIEGADSLDANIALFKLAVDESELTSIVFFTGPVQKVYMVSSLFLLDDELDIREVYDGLKEVMKEQYPTAEEEDESDADEPTYTLVLSDDEEVPYGTVVLATDTSRGRKSVVMTFINLREFNSLYGEEE